MAKKKQTPLEDLTKDELIKKCLNQRENIKQLQDKLKQIETKCDLLQTYMSSKSSRTKIDIYMEETLSFMEDIEELKKEIATLKGVNNETREPKINNN